VEELTFNDFPFDAEFIQPELPPYTVVLKTIRIQQQKRLSAPDLQTTARRILEQLIAQAIRYLDFKKHSSQRFFKAAITAAG